MTGQIDNSNLETLTAPLVLASDIHLRTMEDQRGQLLLDVIRRIGPKVEYFILNGDVFDFCLGDSEYFRLKFAKLGDALSSLASRGTRVVFIEGNHEFHIERMAWRGVEFVTRPDYVVTLSSGLRVKLAHGDLIKNDLGYRAFRGLIKSQFVRLCARALPASWIDAYALKHSEISRSRDKYRKLDHELLINTFDRWLTDGVYDHGVVGHFHVPYAEPRRRGKGLILSVDCWDKPNLLVFQDGEFYRAFLQQPREPIGLEPVRSFLP